MDWRLIGHGVLRYSLLYAGTTVATVTFLTRSGMALLGLVLLGFVLLLFVAGGTGQVRMGTAMTNAQAGGLRTGITDPLSNQATAMEADLKVLFYALGLVGCAFVALVLVG